MSVKVVLSERAIEQFYSLPIKIQETLDDRIEWLAEREAGRDQALSPGVARRRRFHGFYIDLRDDYWHEITLETLFNTAREEMQVVAIGYRMEEK